MYNGVVGEEDTRALETAIFRVDIRQRPLRRGRTAKIPEGLNREVREAGVLDLPCPPRVVAEGHDLCEGAAQGRRGDDRLTPASPVLAAQEVHGPRPVGQGGVLPQRVHVACRYIPPVAHLPSRCGVLQDEAGDAHKAPVDAREGEHAASVTQILVDGTRDEVVRVEHEQPVATYGRVGCPVRTVVILQRPVDAARIPGEMREGDVVRIALHGVVGGAAVGGIPEEWRLLHIAALRERLFAVRGGAGAGRRNRLRRAQRVAATRRPGRGGGGGCGLDGAAGRAQGG
mmetsp:Transcript_136457/g.423997  ORF Transcript_136457/g.423997 Transcript_136457/m.423997 type:complete len:286 (+) Transcript_136457:420-1277(+)